LRCSVRGLFHSDQVLVDELRDVVATVELPDRFDEGPSDGRNAGDAVGGSA